MFDIRFVSVCRCVVVISLWELYRSMKLTHIWRILLYKFLGGLFSATLIKSRVSYRKVNFCYFRPQILNPNLSHKQFVKQQLSLFDVHIPTDSISLTPSEFSQRRIQCISDKMSLEWSTYSSCIEHEISTLEFISFPWPKILPVNWNSRRRQLNFQDWWSLYRLRKSKPEYIMFS